MPISLGTVNFDEATTAVCERHEEVGGRNARQIELRGVVSGSSLEGLEAALDAILAAASEEECVTPFSLRADRRLLVRRTKFSREVARTGLTAAFVLTLEADNPFEESSEEHLLSWPIQANGDLLAFQNEGTAPALLKIYLTAVGPLIQPGFGDGVRALFYRGTVSEGQTLVFDGVSGTLTLDGSDVTPYTSGVFPQLAPGEGLLQFRDDETSSHLGAATVRFRDRWW